jgi:GT2 family glycosyltransferase
MVVNFNTAGLLQPMFDALRQADGERLASYLVVDNASRDDSVQRMAQVCPEALLLSNKQNVGLAGPTTSCWRT